MPEETVCVHCSTLIEQVAGKAWYHRPSPGSYKAACPGIWGKTAKPVVTDAE